MTHTEDELRAVLAERVPGGPPDVREIVRRGRRIKRRRSAAGVTLAGAAATAVALLVQGSWLVAQPVEKVPPMAAMISPPSDLPLENTTLAGSSPLIKTHSFETMAVDTTVTFQPLSLHTSYKIICTDPKAWALIRSPGGTGSISECGKEGAGGHYNERSVSPGWLERPQRLNVWILPGDLPISRPRANHIPKYADCKVIRKEVGLCDGKYLLTALLRPGVAERLAAELGQWPGRWEIGIYDRAGATVPPWPVPTKSVPAKGVPTKPVPTKTVTVKPKD